ncbi:MAG: ABC transporter permease [Ilumatobacteraceae bacterium]
MSAQPTDTEAPAETEQVGLEPVETSSRRGPLSYLWTPLLVGAAWLALYLWLQQRQLDNIERRTLTWGTVRTAFLQHLDISLWATFWVIVLAVPVGIVLTRPFAKRFAGPVVTIANVGQGIPSLGTIVLAFLIVSRSGRNAAIVGLVAYSFLPILRGTMVGLQQVPREMIKAARGMGMGRWQVLRHIELPLSVPVVLTGVRTSLVLTVSSAPLAAFIGGGTLGALITSGFALTRPTLIYTGSLLAAGLALLADWAGGIVEDVLRPKGL